MAGEVLQLTGDLTFAEPQASDQWLERLPTSKEYQIDLSGIGNIDSTAVVVLIRLQRRAEVNDAKVIFVNVPERLQRLLKFYSLSDSINLAPAGAGSA